MDKENYSGKEEPPNTQDEDTFNRSMINWDRRWNGSGSLLPESLVKGKEVYVRGESFVVYRKEGN